MDAEVAGDLTAQTPGLDHLPAWLPPAVRDYVVHTRDGRSIRAIARDTGCQPSTISRRVVRRIENRRDDPLVDHALLRLGRFNGGPPDKRPQPENRPMTTDTDIALPDDETLKDEARRVLRRLAEQGACLALAPGMETAVVVREAADDGPAVRTAVVDRSVAEAMALQSWIQSSGGGKVLRYYISATGRTALRRLVAEAENRKARGESPEAHASQGPEPRRDEAAKTARYTLAESPLLALARRRDKAGKPFLGERLVAAGERLREDFELALLADGPTPDWHAFVTGERAPEPLDATCRNGPEAARARVSAALAALGAGLGDVAFRCCCKLEGLESAEQRMGWSARSGKIVLRIALQRLKLHYDTHSDQWSPLIG